MGIKNSSFGVAMSSPKVEANFGIMLRSAYVQGADLFVVLGTGGRRRAATDTPNAFEKIPILYFSTLEDARSSLPHYSFVGVEQGGESLPGFSHPAKAIYVLGNEARGLLSEEIEGCHKLVEIPSKIPVSLNVAQAGAMVLYDRLLKESL